MVIEVAIPSARTMVATMAKPMAMKCMTWHLVLTCEDAKARRNKPSTGNFRTLGKNILSLKARQKRKLGHFKKKEKNGPREQRDMSKVMESFGQMLIVQFEECSVLGGNLTVPSRLCH